MNGTTELDLSQKPADKTVHLVALGCARNRVDAEVMLGGLTERGWTITDSEQEANLIIINTCGFIGPAKEESIDTILDCARHKETNPNLKIVVSGCLTQRYKSQLKKGLPEVDLFVGTDEFPRLPELLAQGVEKGSVFAKRSNYLYEGELPKLNTLSQTSAYVKVAEGCQHKCAFCIIPAIRGPLRSRPVESVMGEVQKLAEGGVREINLIAQDLAAYGREHQKFDLLDLLQKLEDEAPVDWIRMLYAYPENIDDRFLEFFASSKKLVKYLDVPVQHGSDAVLARMKRDISNADLRRVFSELRERVPGISLRTSVMVGFPGETEEEFLELLELVRDVKFDHLGCFSYSQEEGTVAGRMTDQIDEETKLGRLERVMSLQQEISRERLTQYIGQVVQVLVEGPSPDSEFVWRGRMSTQAPEVDGVVYITDGDPVKGAIQSVEITEAHDYDLVGRVVTVN